MTWRLAKSLETLRNQINELYPDRNKASDGTIGDARHQAQVSDHNPDTHGVVAAFDITHDSGHGLDIAQFSERLANSRDRRIKYLIRNHEIMVPAAGWHWQRYTGTDPHTSHLHLSVNAANYDDDGLWGNLVDGGKGAGAPAPMSAPGTPSLPITVKVINRMGAIIRIGPGINFPKASVNVSPANGILDYESTFEVVDIREGDFVDYTDKTGRKSNKWLVSRRGNCVSAVVTDIPEVLLNPPAPQPAPVPAPTPEPAPAPQETPAELYQEKFAITDLPGGGFEIYPLAEATVRSIENDNALTVDPTHPLIVKYASSFDGRVYYLTEANFVLMAAMGFRADEFTATPPPPKPASVPAGVAEATKAADPSISLRDRLVVLLAAILSIFDFKNK